VRGSWGVGGARWGGGPSAPRWERARVSAHATAEPAAVRWAGDMERRGIVPPRLETVRSISVSGPGRNGQQSLSSMADQ
jgi:hypothetical protein